MRSAATSLPDASGGTSDGRDITAAMASPRPSYLITQMSLELRRELSAQAADKNVSLADVVRVTLGEHYGLERRPISPSYIESRDSGSSRTMVLRLDEELFEAIRGDAWRSKRTMRQVILDVLTDRFLVSLGT